MKRILGLIVLMALSSGLKAQESKDLITYKKGACFGKCPIYNISINTDGKMVFEAKMFLDQLGTFERKLSRKEFRILKRRFRRARMHKIVFQDDSRIMDAPMTTIGFKNKEIESKIGTPQNLKKAESYLLSLTPLNAAGDFKWEFMAKIDSIKKDTKTKPNGRIENAQSELIVELNDGIEINEWIKGYHRHGLLMKKKIVPNRSLYLLTYHPKSTSTKSVLKLLKNDKAVKTVEKNLKIQERR